MKTVTIIASVLLSGLTLPLSGQCLKGGDNVFDLSIGGIGVSDYSYGKTNARFFPTTLKAEHMFTDKISIGFNVNYQETSTRVEENENYYNENKKSARVMGTMNFHFTTTDDFDSYKMMGAGYLFNDARKSTNDLPNYSSFYYDRNFPYTARIAIGTRYFMTKHVGMNMEIGLGGGSLLQGGFCFKL
jgi:hypothetical protein